MSILIKGMEMLKDRPQLLWVYPNGKALIVQSDVDPWKELQAVPIPTPHGRLIDADAEVARVQNLYNKAVEKDPEMGCVSVYEGEIAVLKLAPTIIPAEEGE